MSSYPEIHKRANTSVPYGYVDDPDHRLLQPVDKDLDLLLEVLEFLNFKAMSFRDAAIYVSHEGSREITYEGLRLLYRNKTHPI